MNHLLPFFALVTCLLVVDAGEPTALRAAEPIQQGEMAGYLLIPNERVPSGFDAGFSMYVAAWPLLSTYPGHRFQSGLPGTWMNAQYSGPKPEHLYSDIEGGMGWWTDTRFATITPKFIMGGVAPNFIEWANGPGAGKGRDWDQPKGKYAIVQLSPWVLWPPDGLNLKQGACGQLFGYGYLPLPLIDGKSTTAGQSIPTGDQCWTLFINSGNFKGPLTFFTPYFWSHAAVLEPRLNGLLLDTRPSNPNRPLQMETQYIPAVQAVDGKGERYARVAPTSFPRNADGNSALVHRVTSYNRQALWDGVKAWFAGGPPVSGTIDPKTSIVHHFNGGGGATWKIYPKGAAKDAKFPIAWNTLATPTALDPTTFGYHWNDAVVTHGVSASGSLATLPEYFHQVMDEAKKKAKWVPVKAEETPKETGLVEYQFEKPRDHRAEPYITPDESASCWKKPGPAAGPFRAQLGDGSVVTYYWYRFADQPAMLNADLTDQEREAVQARVEKLHRTWTKDREYLPPPTVGQLADIDPALIVTPPPGMEAGYVPIVTRQEAKE